MRRKDMVSGYLFIAPPLIGFTLFSLVPIVFSIIMSFNHYDFFTKEMNFAGFANYMQAFTDPIFLKSIGNIFIALLGLVFQIAFTLGVAYLLCFGVKGEMIFRVLFFIPSLCSSVAVTLVWKWVFNTDFGILNNVLGLFGIPNIAWLNNQRVVMLAMIIQGVWMGIGGGMVMYIAAIKNAPSEYYEAAEIDGANGWQKFFKITLPVISPTTFYIFVTSVIGTMSDFTRYKLMTNGGPNDASMTPVLYLYQVAFSATYEYNYSYSAALAWILGIIIIALVGVTFLTSKKWVHYSD